MRLELGTFPVTDVIFGSTTRWQDGVLQIYKEEVLAAVLDDPRIVKAELEIARPGESVRIWPVRDMLEPRIKVKGPGVVYPGICGREVTTVGQGRTHRLSGVSVLEVSNVNWHDAGGDYVDVFVDMSGPWAEALPHISSLINVCLIVEADSELGIEPQNYAVHGAALKVSDMLAPLKELEPPELEVYALEEVDPSLPRVVYVMCNHSPQHMAGSLRGFSVATYGLTQLNPPWLLHPNEILDGAVSGPYRTAFATSWAIVNNPILLELYRRHGVDFNLTGVIVCKTEWTTEHEKNLVANQCAKVAKMVDAQGAIFTWDAGGNEFIEVIRAVQACEREGIKTLFVTSEDNPEGRAATVLEPVREADAVVSTGFFVASQLNLPPLPSSQQVIFQRLVSEPLQQLGLRFQEVDKYATELHNPEVTEPAGSGNVPELNYRIIASLAALAGEIDRSDITRFVHTHGMPGFSPTQGHIASAVPFMAQAVDRLKSGQMKRAMFLAKGSLFLGRMTQLADGLSFILERNKEAS